MRLRNCKIIRSLKVSMFQLVARACNDDDEYIYIIRNQRVVNNFNTFLARSFSRFDK